MNKQQLIAAVAEDTLLPKAKAELAVNAVIDQITLALSKGDDVSLVGFGRFETRKRAARSASNPQTRESILVPARTVPAFKPGTLLKNAVN